MRHKRTAAAPPRPFQVGDRVAVDPKQPSGLVVAVYPIRGRDASLVVWRALSGRYEMGEADQIHLVAERDFADRRRWIDRPNFDAQLAVEPAPAGNEHARADVAAMRETMRRVLFAIEFAHRAADLIRQPQEDTSSIGWAWADGTPAARAMALCVEAERQLEDLLASCVVAVTCVANDAAMRGEVTP